MIPGDIDLTENLDFRKIKSSEKLLPTVPWVEEKSNNNFMYNFSYNITETSSSTYTWNLFDSNHDNILSSFTNDYYTTSVNINYGGYILEVDNYDNLGNIEYSYSPRLSSTSTTFIDCKSSKYKYRDTDNIPWDIINKIKDYSKKLIPWYIRCSKFNDLDNLLNDIPWKCERKKQNKESKIQEKIVWLKGLKKYELDAYLDHLDDNNKNDSYLTNMQWIGIRD